VSTIAVRQVNEEPQGAPLDVRQASEWASGHIPGAVHLELGSVMALASAIPAGPLIIYCGHGERAMTAASLLEGQGRANLAVLDGGFDAWRSAKRLIATG
jgi:rhodanese-related sulfurtransferase